MLPLGNDPPMYSKLSGAPHYHAWAEGKREQGESEELLAKMENVSFWVRHSELVELRAKDFERLFGILKNEQRNNESA
ncbi:hypothetical protein GC197_10530 [bacterium]|nr:hypothetical protein [bacterium]